jgi:hypothetical protein
MKKKLHTDANLNLTFTKSRRANVEKIQFMAASTGQFRTNGEI